jgi:hypothetical protein
MARRPAIQDRELSGPSIRSVAKINLNVISLTQAFGLGAQSIHACQAGCEWQLKAEAHNVHQDHDRTDKRARVARN